MIEIWDILSFTPLCIILWWLFPIKIERKKLIWVFETSKALPLKYWKYPLEDTECHQTYLNAIAPCSDVMSDSQHPPICLCFPTWVPLYRVLILSFPHITVSVHLRVHQLFSGACSPHSASTLSYFHDTRPYVMWCHFFMLCLFHGNMLVLNNNNNPNINDNSDDDWWWWWVNSYSYFWHITYK